jgi:hypothetical protein
MSSGSRKRRDPSEYAVELLTWLRQGYPAPPEQLWVAAQDLEHVFYPQFLAATEWPAYPWRTVAKHLKRITRTRQKDGRRGLG